MTGMLQFLDDIGDLVRAQPIAGLGLAIVLLISLAAMWSALERRNSRRRMLERKRRQNEDWRSRGA